MDTNKISGGMASVPSGIGSGKAREEAMGFLDWKLIKRLEKNSGPADETAEFP